MGNLKPNFRYLQAMDKIADLEAQLAETRRELSEYKEAHITHGEYENEMREHINKINKEKTEAQERESSANARIAELEEALENFDYWLENSGFEKCPSCNVKWYRETTPHHFPHYSNCVFASTQNALKDTPNAK